MISEKSTVFDDINKELKPLFEKSEINFKKACEDHKIPREQADRFFANLNTSDVCPLTLLYGYFILYIIDDKSLHETMICKLNDLLEREYYPRSSIITIRFHKAYIWQSLQTILKYWVGMLLHIRKEPDNHMYECIYERQKDGRRVKEIKKNEYIPGVSVTDGYEPSREHNIVFYAHGRLWNLSLYRCPCYKTDFSFGLWPKKRREPVTIKREGPSGATVCVTIRTLSKHKKKRLGSMSETSILTCWWLKN